MTFLFLIMGSYCGQDSFGDKYLLKAVQNQLKQHIGGNITFISHVHSLTESDKEKFPGIELAEGISSIYWPWHNRLSFLPLPFAFRIIIAIITLPIYLGLKPSQRRKFAHVCKDISNASCFYFYGGTQLVDKWFWLNFIPLVLTALLCKVYSVPIFIGPQQYGPQSAWQKRWFKLFLHLNVRDIRTRNVNDLILLKLRAEALVYDEVYSCIERYPIIDSNSRRRSFLLINMRGANDLYNKEVQTELYLFAKLIKILQEQTNLPCKLFQMSGPTFSDDLKVTELLDKQNVIYEIVPAVDEEHLLIELAQQAYGTISASFHGCVLSLLGGCPAIPVTFGSYYDYKYKDFSRYSGNQEGPIVYLLDMEPEEVVKQIIHYFETFDPIKIASTRREAALQISSWYKSIATQLDQRFIAYD